MRCNLFEGRRFLVQVLLGVSVVVGSASPARAQEKAKAANKPAEYAEDTFVPASIRVWRFDQEKKPAVLLLHGADGGVGVEKLYCAEAKRLASKGFVVFIVHYLDSTKPEEPAKISDLVKRAICGKATEEEKPRVERYFDVWTSCGMPDSSQLRLRLIQLATFFRKRGVTSTLTPCSRLSSS